MGALSCFLHQTACQPAESDAFPSSFPLLSLPMVGLSLSFLG